MVRYVAALALTLTVELVAYSLLWRGSDRPQRTAIRVTVVTNVCTHPATWFVVLPLLDALLPFWIAVAIVELTVVAVEAVILARLVAISRPDAVVTAIIANAASFASGLAVELLARM